MMYVQFLFIAAVLMLAKIGNAATPFSPYADITLNTHWDASTQNMAPMDLTQTAKEQGIPAYHLAFITDSGQCQPAWGGQDAFRIDKAWGKQLTDKLNQSGIAITVSFGGANGNDLSFNCDADQLSGIFEQSIKQYHASTLDFDIENGTANIPRLLQAIKVSQQNNPDIKISFTLPVMPEGLTASGKDVIASAKRAGIRFHVNIMAMDYGPAYAGDMGEYAIQAASNVQQYMREIYPEQTDNLLWNRIEVTPMIGVNDVNSEQFTLRNADELKQFADTHQFGGLSMWSLTRDAPCADQWASPICSGNNLQEKPYDFSKRFLAGS